MELSGDEKRNVFYEALLKQTNLWFSIDSTPYNTTYAYLKDR